jgi:hypothetical protein
MRQAVVTAAGLALGIGLVITVTALSSGVRTSQDRVLGALFGGGNIYHGHHRARAGVGRQATPPPSSSIQPPSRSASPAWISATKNSARSLRRG